MLKKPLALAVVAFVATGAPGAADDAGGPATDLDSLRARLHAHDHNWMMFATIKALSTSDREYLEPELELLATLYTTFPDQNWANQGEWGGWSGSPDAGRTPNLRREWGISHACRYSPVGRQGQPLSLHAPPGSYQAARVLFPRIVGLLKQGRHGDGVRMFGALSHAVQDSATFPHMQALHRAAHFRFDEIDVGDYQPARLGNTPEEAAEALARRTEAMVHFTEKQALRIRAAMARADGEENSALRVQCCNEAAKVLADAVHTAILLAGPKPDRPQPPPGANLVCNATVEEADFGEPWPAGWVAHWNDPQDRLGRLEWAGLIPRNRNLWHSGRHSLKLMWAGPKGLEWRQTWPAAIWVRPGQRYRATAWVRTEKATGQTDLAIEMARRNVETVAVAASDPVAGDHDWTQLSVEVTVPDGAERLRLVLRSRANDGAAWFDDAALVRLDPRAAPPGAPKRAAPKAEDLMLWLSFSEGKGTHVGDRSPYAGLNGPNLLASSGVPSDLFVAEGRRGPAVALDGKDDFVECPFSYVQDVLCPEKAMTLMLWVRAGDHRDGVLVEKREQVPGRPARGYRLATRKDGLVELTVYTDQGPVTATSAGPLPTGRWTHVAAVRTPERQLTVFLDGRPGKAQGFSGTALAPKMASLYLGASTGVAEFFAGRLDEVRVLSRALDAAEVAKEAGRP